MTVLEVSTLLAMLLSVAAGGLLLLRYEALAPSQESSSLGGQDPSSPSLPSSAKDLP